LGKVQFIVQKRLEQPEIEVVEFLGERSDR